MVDFELLRNSGVLVLSPEDALTAEDFGEISRTVEPFIQENGKLTGLLLEAPSFPGWNSWDALIEHVRFVREHHRKIERVAIVTDNSLLTKVAPKVAEHFAHPEFRAFGGGQKAQALEW